MKDLKEFYAQWLLSDFFERMKRHPTEEERRELFKELNEFHLTDAERDVLCRYSKIKKEVSEYLPKVSEISDEIWKLWLENEPSRRDEEMSVKCFVFKTMKDSAYKLRWAIDLMAEINGFLDRTEPSYEVEDND